MNTYETRSDHQNPNMNLTQIKSYSTVAKTNNVIFPSKELGIVINCIENIPIEEHIYAVGDIIGANNITHVSKISNQRICIFLSKKELVNDTVNKHKFIKLENQIIEIRRYITPAQRLVISNVIPSIPNSLIEEGLRLNNIKTVCPITFLKAGMKRLEYSHIFSFRRQVYIHDNAEITIPTSMQIEYEGTQHRVYLSTEITCFACKQTGHTANQCNNKKDTDKIETNVVVHTNNTEMSLLTQNKTTAGNTENINPKRHAPSTSSIEDVTVDTLFDKIINDNPNSSQEVTVTSKQKKIQKKLKKLRPETPENEQKIPTKELIQPLKEEMEKNPQKYTLSYENLADFFENVQGSSDQIDIARQYTADIKGLITTLRDLHPHLTNRSTKNRFTRLINRIRAQLGKELDNLAIEGDTEDLSIENSENEHSAVEY